MWWSCRVRYLVFQQLGLTMEHHKRDSINAPPHSEACFGFERGFNWGAHTYDGSPPWLGFEPRFLPELRAQRSTTEQSSNDLNTALRPAELTCRVDLQPYGLQSWPTGPTACRVDLQSWPAELTCNVNPFVSFVLLPYHDLADQTPLSGRLLLRRGAGQRQPMWELKIHLRVSTPLVDLKKSDGFHMFELFHYRNTTNAL